MASSVIEHDVPMRVMVVNRVFAERHRLRIAHEYEGTELVAIRLRDQELPPWWRPVPNVLAWSVRMAVRISTFSPASQ